jgi:hypothetical protein
MTVLAPIRDEIRKTMAIHALFKMYRKPSMKMKDQHVFLEEVFHGNNKTGVVSQGHQVLHGLPPFNLLYNKQTELIVNSNIDSTINTTSLILKTELSQSETVIMAGRDLTRAVLEQTTFTGPSLMKGRKLLNDAKTALLYIRKALGALHQMSEVTFVGNEIQYKSGVSPEEVKEKLLNIMYELLKPKPDEKPDEVPKSVSVEGENDEEEEVSFAPSNTPNKQQSTTRPKGRTFPGWMAFIVFGPFAEPRDRLDLIEIAENGDEMKTGANSRKTLRKENSEAKNLKREYSVDKFNGDVTRGVSMAHKLSVQTLQIKSRELNIKERESNNIHISSRVLNLQLQLSNMIKLLDRHENRAKAYTTTYDPNHILWKKVHEYEDAIEKLQDRISEMYETQPGYTTEACSVISPNDIAMCNNKRTKFNDSSNNVIGIDVDTTIEYKGSTSEDEELSESIINMVDV